MAIGGLFFIFIANILLLTPLLINFYSASNNTKVELEALKSKPASNDYRDLENTIRDTKIAMDLLKSDMAERQHIARTIIEALDNRTEGISIDSIYWASDDSGKRLNLNGVASTREVLRKYVLTLQSNKAFSGVDIPVSAFAKAEEAGFSITIKVNQANQ